MKSIFFITLLFPIFIFCCKKHDEHYQPIQISCTLTKDLDSCRSLIQGTWTWLEEKRIDRVRQRFVYLTPKNQGYKLSLTLVKDTARFYKNNRPDSVYTFRVARLTEISGTNFPEDNDPVLVFYSLHNGLRDSHVPIKICSNYLLMQNQFVSSIIGEEIWRRQ
jgi:hypothetical protein